LAGPVAADPGLVWTAHSLENHVVKYIYIYIYIYDILQGHDIGKMNYEITLGRSIHYSE